MGLHIFFKEAPDIFLKCVLDYKRAAISTVRILGFPPMPISGLTAVDTLGGDVHHLWDLLAFPVEWKCFGLSATLFKRSGTRRKE